MRSRPKISAKILLASLTALAGAALIALPRADAGPPSVALPPTAHDVPIGAGGLQSVVLSGGCFWGVQGVFEHVRGVRQAISGYAGGKASTAHYEVVGSGLTGHAESVQIIFDPKQITFGEILRIYFSVATDPTQLNHQFPDEGPQYRGEIFYTSEPQKTVATAYIGQLNAAKLFKVPIVTRVDSLPGFFRAEGYHQDYLTLHPQQPYIATYDMPKVAALKALFPTRYRAVAVRVE